METEGRSFQTPHDDNHFQAVYTLILVSLSFVVVVFCFCFGDGGVLQEIVMQMDVGDVSLHIL